MRTRLGHYDIVAELGRGGMGVVYKGYEESLHRYVAIKVLADSLAHDESIRERFLREARSMAALNDPHIIQIHFIGEEDGQPYFVMEFVEGESLGSMLKRDHRLTVEQAAKIIHQTAQGLATAHDLGVIHRDIKPGNLMISNRGTVKIADFGIALSNQDLSKKLTSTGEFVGTPGYLSPEVCLGKPVDRRSDIFSLGIVLFEMLTGKMPFNDESPLGLMLEVVKAEIPDVRELNASVDPEIARILARMIAKEPGDRYQDCHELVADLAVHPLVAKGGPITVQTKLSPAAATLIGQKTPASGQAALHRTPPTPMRVQANTRITTSGQPEPPTVGAATAHRPVLDRPTVPAGQRRGSALPWAIAAALLLVAAGGTWAMRDRVPAIAALFGPSSPSPAATATVAQTSVTSVAPSLPATQTPSAADSVASAPSTVAQAGAPPAEQAVGTTATADPAAAVAATDDADAPAARASQAGIDALRDLPAAKAAESGEAAPAPRVAKVTTPETPSAPPRPRVPTIAVVSAGDNVISSPAGDALVDLLQARGFRVIEGRSTKVGSYAGKASAVVVVDARPVGSQEMTYYGQVSTLYTVQLGVKAYRVADGSVMWSSGSEQVNFTNLNAADQARDAVEPMLDRIDGRLDEFRPRGGRG